MKASVLVVAKAPAAGLAKTRLGATIGMQAAADLAASALLDTLEICSEVFENRYLALDGELAGASRGDEIAQALTGWTVFEQHGASLGSRLAHAHAWVASRGVGSIVQVGMDTPQLTDSLLGTIVDELARGAEIVLGPAADGGWWVLGLADGARAAVLVDVVMSEPGTYAATAAALSAGATAISTVEELRDVDTLADAEAVAALSPGTRFARTWRGLAVVAS